MSDIVVMVSKCGTEHRTNWTSLALRSPHFQNMENSGMMESTTNRILVDASSLTILTFLNWIDTGKLPSVGLRCYAELGILGELWMLDELVNCVVAGIHLYPVVRDCIPTISKLPPKTPVAILNTIVQKTVRKVFEVPSPPLRATLTPYMLGMLSAYIGWHNKDRTALQCAVGVVFGCTDKYWQLLHPDFLDYTIVDESGNHHGVSGILLTAAARAAMGNSKEIEVLEKYEDVQVFIEWVHCGYCRDHSPGFVRLCGHFGCQQVSRNVIKGKRPGLLLNRYSGTDMEFVSKDNHRHVAHWVALASCGTDYFVELKQAGNNEVEVDVDGDVIETFLRWMYTDNVKSLFCNTTIFVELYKLSVLWEMDVLRWTLMENIWSSRNFLKSKMNWFCQVWKMAIENDLPEIMAALGVGLVLETYTTCFLGFEDIYFLKQPFLQGWLSIFCVQCGKQSDEVRRWLL